MESQMDPDVQPLRMDQHTLRKDSLDQSSGVPSNNEPTMSQDEQTLQYHIDAVTADDDGEEDLKLTEQVAALYAHLTALASGPGLVPLPQHAQQQQQQIQQPPGDPRERLISFLSPAISPEASGMLFDAGFETLEAVRGLHPGNHSTQDASHDELVGKVGVDLDSIEDYLEKRFKPGHRKQILQYVLTPQPTHASEVSDATLLAALQAAQAHLALLEAPTDSHTPYQEEIYQTTFRHESPSPKEFPSFEPPLKRPRTIDGTKDYSDSRSHKQPHEALDSTLRRLEGHFLESPITKGLRLHIDYSLEMVSPQQGLFKCLICRARPVTIKMRTGGRQPQISNVGAHFKTHRHQNALGLKGRGRGLDHISDPMGDGQIHQWQKESGDLVDIAIGEHGEYPQHMASAIHAAVSASSMAHQPKDY